MNIFSRRKTIVFDTKQEAVDMLKSRLSLFEDGEPMISRYKDSNDLNRIKTILGIKYGDPDLSNTSSSRVLLFSEIESGDDYIIVLNDEDKGCLKISLGTGANGVLGRILTLENYHLNENCDNRISVLENTSIVHDALILSLNNDVKYHVSLKVKDPQIYYYGNIERFNAALNSNYDISDNTKIVDIVDNNDSSLHLTTEIGLITSIQGRCLNWTLYFNVNDIVDQSIDVKHRDATITPPIDVTIGLYKITKNISNNSISFLNVETWTNTDNDYQTIFRIVRNFIANANDIIIISGMPNNMNDALLELTNAITSIPVSDTYNNIKYDRIKILNNFNGDLNLVINSGTFVTGSHVVYPQLFNLTKMFGAGNEPTILEFNAMFPKINYDYALNSVIGLKLNKLITTGFNNAKQIEGDSTGLNKEAIVFRRKYYLRHVDPNEIYFKGVNDSQFRRLVGVADPDTSHTNSYYVDIPELGILHIKSTDVDYSVYPVLYNKNTTPNTEYRIYDYEEYNEYEMDLSWINNLKDQLGNIIFPDGLLSTIDRSAYDEITNEYAIKRCEIQNNQIVRVAEKKYPIWNPMLFACDFWGVKKFETSAGNSPIYCKIKYFSNSRDVVRFLLDLVYKNEARFVRIEDDINNLYEIKIDKLLNPVGEKLCYSNIDGSVYETVFDSDSFEAAGSVLDLLDKLTDGTVIVDSSINANNAINSTNSINATNATNATYDSNNVHIGDKLIELERRIEALEQA